MHPEIVFLRDGRSACLRAARPADRDAVQQFVRGLSPTARRRRFFGPVAELSPDQLDRVTLVRDPRELALVALAPASQATQPTRVVALAQYALESAREAEFALAVADDWVRCGLGTRLLQRLVIRAIACGVHAMNGDVLAENWPMLGLLAGAGFELVADGDPELIRTRKVLAPDARPGPLARLAASVGLGMQVPTRPFAAVVAP